MAVDKLFVSFWEICFENLPVGTLTHRQITSEDARDLLRRAKKSGTLCCLSNGDLCAPYNSHERKSYESLCDVLRTRYRTRLSIDDFYSKQEDQEGTFRMAVPLQIGQITRSSPLMVVYSLFVLDPKRRKENLTFKVDPDSVQFHLFETADIATSPRQPHRA